MSKITQDEERNLKEKIEKSEIFTIIVNKGYLEKLIDLDPKFWTQIRIAEELRKPFLIIIDSNLSSDDKDLSRSIFSGFNVIKEEELDLSNVVPDQLYDEIEKLAREYEAKKGKNIEEEIEIIRE